MSLLFAGEAFAQDVPGEPQPIPVVPVPAPVPPPPVLAPTAPVAPAVTEPPDERRLTVPYASVLDLRSRLMYWKGGFSSGIYQQGLKLDLGIFGSNVERYFAESPEALASARLYRSLTIAGSVIYVVGIATLVGDVVYTSYAAAAGGSAPINNVLFYGTLGVGVVLGVGGAILIGIGNGRLHSAVNQWNGMLLNRLLPPGTKLDLQLFTNRDGGGVAVRGTF